MNFKTLTNSMRNPPGFTGFHNVTSQVHTPMNSLTSLFLKYMHLIVNPVSPRTKCSTEIDKIQLHVQLYEGLTKDKTYFVENVKNRDQFKNLLNIFFKFSFESKN